MINPITQVFDVPDGTGLSLSDYHLVFSGASWWSNPGAWFCGTFLAGGLYFLLLTIFAPITWVMDFVTNPDALASILADMGIGLAGSAFKYFPPVAIGTLALMFLITRYVVMPRFGREWGGSASSSTQMRFMGKTGFNYDSTIARGHWKDAERQKSLERITAGFILLIVIAAFVSKPFIVLKKTLEFSHDFVADITDEQGAVTSPMFGVLRGVTALINFGGPVPDECNDAWGESMRSDDPDAIKSCIPSEQVGNMTPGPETAVLVALAIPVVLALFYFAWPFLKNATWFLGVVVWKSIYIPWACLRALMQPERKESRGILDDVMSIFRVIITYMAYYFLIVFIAAFLPAGMFGGMSKRDWPPLVQILLVAVAYYLMGKYVIANIKPGGQVFGTTMLGTPVAYDGWGDWRKNYWENPNERPTQIFQKIGVDGAVLSPAWSKTRRDKKAAKATADAATAHKTTGSDDMLSAADQKTVDSATEKIAVGTPAGANLKAKSLVLGAGGATEAAVSRTLPATTAGPATPAPRRATVEAGAAIGSGIDLAKTPAPATAAAAAALTDPASTAAPVPGTPNAAAPAAADPTPSTTGHRTAEPNWTHHKSGFGASAADAHTPTPVSGALGHADEIIVVGQAVRVMSPDAPTTDQSSPQAIATPTTIDGEVVDISYENNGQPYQKALPAIAPSLRERQEALLRNLYAATNGIPQEYIELTSTGVQYRRPNPATETVVSPNNPRHAADNIDGADQFDGARYPNPLEFDPMNAFSNEATSIDTAPQQSILTTAASERAHIQAIQRAEARGQAIVPQLSPAMEEQQAVFFDPREPGGVAFDRTMGFNDRI